MDEDFWRAPKRPPAEIVAEAMSRLNYTPATEAPPAPAVVPSLYATDEQRLARQDRQDGLNVPLAESEERQRRLGIYMPHGKPRYDVGDEDGRPD